MTYECSCDWDGPSVYSARNVKRARKLARCCECEDEIRPGDPYEYVFGVWEGISSSFHTCQFCRELAVWAKISVPCFCYAHGGGLHEEIRHMVEEVRRDVPGFFFEYGRRVIKIMRRKASRRVPHAP